MKKITYTGSAASFGIAGYFATGDTKELEDDTAAQLLGKPFFSEVAEPAPTKTKAIPAPATE